MYVRSLSGVTKDNFAAQGEIVAKVLPGWHDVDLDTIEVEDKSGYGGSRDGTPLICQDLFLYFLNELPKKMQMYKCTANNLELVKGPSK